MPATSVLAAYKLKSIWKVKGGGGGEGSSSKKNADNVEHNQGDAGQHKRESLTAMEATPSRKPGGNDRPYSSPVRSVYSNIRLPVEKDYGEPLLSLLFKDDDTTALKKRNVQDKRV